MWPEAMLGPLHLLSLRPVLLHLSPVPPVLELGEGDGGHLLALHGVGPGLGWLLVGLGSSWPGQDGVAESANSCFPGPMAG